MDLIQAYHDQGSQSSSSGDDTNFRQKNAASTSYSNTIAMPNKVSSFEPLERIPIDRLMIATAVIAAQQPPNPKQKKAANSFSQWLGDCEKELRMCLGSIQPLQRNTLLDSMDRFISKLSRDYEKIIKPNTAVVLTHFIRTYLHIYKYMFRSMEKGKRYYKRFIKILAIYTDLELSASIRGTEYDKTIAERIVLNYQTYLDHTDNAMVLDVWLNTKRLWREHRGILVLLFEYFLMRTLPMELPDALFMKNLIMFKKWMYIEEVPEERRKALEAFVKCVKPKKSICMNSLFKPYLPVDLEGFVTIDNSNDILDKEYTLTPLIRTLKRSDMQIELNEKAEVIVLTDDESEPDEDSATCSNYDESDFDWYSASSQQDNQSLCSQNFIETISIDSPQPSKETPSLSSLDSFDLNLDTTSSLVVDHNGDSTHYSDFSTEKAANADDTPSITDQHPPIHETNGDNRRLSTPYESTFNRIVNEMNSTHLIIPGNGTISNDGKLSENGQSRQTIDKNESVNYLNDCATDKWAIQSANSDEACSDNDKINGVVTHANHGMTPCSSNGDENVLTINDHNLVVANDMPSIVSMNHVKLVEPIKNCDNNVNVISSAFPRNHGEAVRRLNEIDTTDLRNREAMNAETENGKAVDSVMPLQSCEIESSKENANTSETIQDWLPAAESTASVTEVLSNGPTEEASKSANNSPHPYNDSPVEFQLNSTDPNAEIRTYSRGPHLLLKKRISMQARFNAAACSTPSFTIEESYKSKKDQYLLNEKEDDESFLHDIFNTTDLPSRSVGSPRIQSPIVPNTPNAYQPTESSSTIEISMSSTPNVSEIVQSTMINESGSAEVVVKRKRGRPRKYPLPIPGSIPIVPKPPKASRPPRQRKPVKVPKNDVETVFEKRVLRERKPKIKEAESEFKSPMEPIDSKPKKHRRNTIKMTIDAIFNTQSSKLRAIQARRISQILGIPITSQKIATILKRRNYNKSIDVSKNISDKSLNENSMLQTFKRPNGQLNSSEPIGQTTSSTILARKTYIKPNITLSSLSSLSSFSSALRRFSFSTRRISFSSSIRQNREKSVRKPNTQRYTKIDIFDVSNKRGRKSGNKESTSRKKSTRKSKAEPKFSTDLPNVIELSAEHDASKVMNQSKEVAELDTTNELNIEFTNIQEALSSTQHIQESDSIVNKRRYFTSEDTETNITSEFTTDPESTVEDIDDSHTRKSKRSRKRPKILDL